MEVIFGRDFKLEAADPYLFFAYEFRHFTLLTRLIVTIGYGFGDTHINKMLTQSLRSDHERRLLLIQLCGEGEAAAMKKAEIADRLELSQEHADQVVVRPGSAKEFLETPELAKLLISSIPRSEDSPF